MLAIDRLKKLKLAAKRTAQQNVELFQAPSLPAEQCESYLSPSVIYHSPSQPCIGPLKSPSYFLRANSDIYRRPGESLCAIQPQSLTAHQPEMVAIQVKRLTNVQSPVVYDVSSAEYESFHGVPVRDTSIGRVVSPYDDTSHSHMRRASGDAYALTPCSASPYSMMTPPSCVSGGSARSRGSAPSTPLHITSRLAPSSVTPKKIPPAPPQRTNSVKVSAGPLVADINSQHSSSQFRTANFGSLDRNSKSHQKSATTAHNIMPCSTTSTSATVMSTTIEIGSTGDCSTLPFANENIGTIRQRGSLNSAAHAVNDDDDTDEKPLYDEYSGTVRRRGRHSKVLSCASFF